MNSVERKFALLMLGCPEVPVQNSLAVYLSWRLRKKGMGVLIAANPSALKLLQLADPERHYTGRMVVLEKCIAEIAEKKQDFSPSFVFIHNDSGLAYLATLHSLSQGEIYAVIFGRHIEELVEEAEKMDGVTVLAARAVHNPMQLKTKIDRVMEKWDA